MLARDLLRALFRRIMAIYFRDIEIVGDVPPASTGGRLFAANHVNALVDPILVLTSAACEISPVAKSTLWKIPGLRWLLDVADAVPIVRRRDDPNKDAAKNDEIFERVAAHLGGGGNILIFPEGTSHNEPHVIALRSGAGRMLARARATGAEKLTFQAVGLEFDARDVFRSRALVLFGPAREVAALGEVDDLVQRITERLRDDLKELLVEGESWDDRLLVARVAEMFANETGDRTLAGWNAIGRRVEAAKDTLDRDDDDLYRKIRDGVASYYSLLERIGAQDLQVARGAQPGDPARIARAIALLVFAPLALVGALLYFVPYQVPRLVVRLAKSDPDSASTFKLGAGLVAHPTFAASWIALAWMRLPTESALVATLVTLTSPFAALAWLDRAGRLRARLRVLLPGANRALYATARAARAEVLELLQRGRARVEPPAVPDASA